MLDNKMPACPFGHSKKNVRRLGIRLFECVKCRRMFDGADDGIVTYGDPARQIERKEQRELRR